MTLTEQTNATLADIAQVMRDNESFVICGHVSPDGDCIGSQLALYHTLLALGKKATCLLVRDEPLEEGLSFMPGADLMVFAGDFEGHADVFVGTDVPTRERIGKAACTVLDDCKTSVTIDHHAADTTMCESVYVDPDAASASMLVWELCKLLISEPPLASAECAYAGLVTDTGGFCFQNSDKRAFAAASELVEYGVDVAAIASKAFQTRTMASLNLEARTIERIETVAEGAGALSWITKADMDELGAQKYDAEPLVDIVRSLAGVRVVCMLREQDGSVRGSLRAKDTTNVCTLAKELGGGGHAAAAGFTLDMPIAQALEFMKGKIAKLVGGSQEVAHEAR